MKFALSCLSLLLLALPPASEATIGLAEWQIATPGGNTIAHSDPWKERHGTFILKGGSDTRRAGSDDEVIVSRIEWWSFIPGYIAGKTVKGFFLVEEKSLSPEYFSTEAELNNRLTPLGVKITKRMLPQDGWNQAWMAPPCRLGEKHPAIVEAVSPEDRKRIRTLIEDQCKKAGFTFGVSQKP